MAQAVGRFAAAADTVAWPGTPWCVTTTLNDHLAVGERIRKASDGGLSGILVLDIEH